VISNCEAEHCDADYWIFSDRRGLRRSPINLDFELIVSPDHRFLYVSEVGWGPKGLFAHLTRIELKTLNLQRVAECATPTLSPSKRSIACRDTSGNVHRFSMPDGPLRPVHTLNLGKKRVYRDAHGGHGLSAVQFIDDTRMRIVTVTQGLQDDGNEEHVEEAKWVEAPSPPAR
jgi:hypothetical protein